MPKCRCGKTFRSYAELREHLHDAHPTFLGPDVDG